MSAYIAIRYTAEGPIFATALTFNEAQVHLGHWVNQQALCLGEAVAIIQADTERVVYFNCLSRAQAFARVMCQAWVQCKRLITNHPVATSAV